MENVVEPQSAEQQFPTSTPLLDVLRPLPQPPLDRLNTGDYFFISSVVILAFVELPFIRSLLDSLTDGSAATFWVAFLTVPVLAFFMSVAVHKAGHLLAARLTGFETVGIKIGPFWARLPWRHRSIEPQEAVPLVTAFIRPRHMDHLRRRLLLLVLAGPLASLLAPLALLGLLWLLPARPGDAYLLASFSVQVFAVLSALYGVAALLPDLDSSGSFSDGARTFMLIENGARARRWFAIFELNALINEGAAAKDWDEQLIVHALAARDESRDAVAASWLAYLWASGRHDLTVATLHLEDALAGSACSTENLRDRLLLEAAFFQSWFRHNAAKGRFWAAQISRLRQQPELQQRRLEIALCWAGGKPFEAWEKLRDYVDELQRLPASPVHKLMDKEAREWKEQMESRMLAGAWATMHSQPQDFDVRNSAATV